MGDRLQDVFSDHTLTNAHFSRNFFVVAIFEAITYEREATFLRKLFQDTDDEGEIALGSEYSIRPGLIVPNIVITLFGIRGLKKASLFGAAGFSEDIDGNVPRGYEQERRDILRVKLTAIFPKPHECFLRRILGFGI